VELTLRAVLGSDALQAGRPEVVTGTRELDSPVRWVHVAEVRDVRGLLRGGELVLSTGLPLRGNDPGAYVADLVDAGAAGLVVELGETLTRLPDAAVDRAREAGFPLVALHAPVRFVEVTEEVHRAIVSDQFAEVDFTRQVHETFTALSLERAGAETIVRVTADLCGSGIVLEDAGRRVIAFSARSRPAASLLADWERRSRQAGHLPTPGISGPEGWFTAPVGDTGERWARLVVPDPNVRQSRLRMVLERAAQALELGRMVERDRLGLRLQAQGGLLADLLNATLDEQSAQARAAGLGLSGSARYVALVVREQSASPRDQADPVAERRSARALVERLSTALAGARLHGLTGVVAGRDAGLLLGLTSEDEATVAATLDRVADLVPGAAVGVGPVSPTVQAAGNGLRQALHVAEVVASSDGVGRDRRRWHRAEDVRLHGLLALLHDDPRVQVFVEAELGPLLAHEAQHGEGLLDLLRDHVAVGGRMTRLAERTHRSRPATYKKVARLERILGCDLSDPASLMSVGVALLAYDRSHRRPGGA
jgi:PucR family transcriptional regulator, purine catabolism regulatory protein